MKLTGKKHTNMNTHKGSFRLYIDKIIHQFHQRLLRNSTEDLWYQVPFIERVLHYA